MKIGIISDSHDRIEKTREAIKILSEKGCSAVIHCGDFCAPFMTDELAAFNGEVHCIFGNIDDRHSTTKKAEESQINLHGDLLELEKDGRQLAANHYPKISHSLASSGKYDAVFYGHNHTPDKHHIENTLFLNPGEIMGRKNKPSIAIYDTKTNDAEFLELS
ncbi:MAG: metallophosphoesterase [Candidatus Pacearchaeota archaeon]